MRSPKAMCWPFGPRLQAAEAVQSVYAEAFEREMASSVSEWLDRLPQAIGPWPWERFSDSAAVVHWPDGRLRLCWQPLPDRVMGSIRLPRLAVAFRFEGLSAEQRAQFMRRFDLVLQRGGG